MTDERYKELVTANCFGPIPKEVVLLTAEEKMEGWHWCYDWDGLLVGPNCPEAESCTCQPP